jgi:hypothetical protein
MVHRRVTWNLERKTIHKKHSKIMMELSKMVIIFLHVDHTAAMVHNESFDDTVHETMMQYAR